MPTATVITDRARTVEATVEGGRILLREAALVDALGWELKPQGLCRDDVCVPVPDRGALGAGGLLDLASVAAALGLPAVVETSADTAVAAVALPEEARRRALDERVAPGFTLPDLDGVDHSLDEWRGRRKLLLAFSSW